MGYFQISSNKLRLPPTSNLYSRKKINEKSITHSALLSRLMTVVTQGKELSVHYDFDIN